MSFTDLDEIAAEFGALAQCDPNSQWQWFYHGLSLRRDQRKSPEEYRRRYVTVRADPKRRRAQLERNRKYRLAIRADPEKELRNRDKRKADYQRLKANPERHAALLAGRRRKYKEMVRRLRDAFDHSMSVNNPKG